MENPIKVLLNYEDSSISEVLFRWQGMIISLAETLGSDGRKYLSMQVANAIDAAFIAENSTATFIISKEDLDFSDATAATISHGLAQPVIEKNT